MNLSYFFCIFLFELRDSDILTHICDAGLDYLNDAARFLTLPLVRQVCFMQRIRDSLDKADTSASNATWSIGAKVSPMCKVICLFLVN